MDTEYFYKNYLFENFENYIFSKKSRMEIFKDKFYFDCIYGVHKLNYSNMFCWWPGAGWVDAQYITHVDASPDGDAFYPLDGWKGWTEEELAVHEGDDTHDHAFRIVKYLKPQS